MRVKIFSRPWDGDPREMETEVNDFLATLTTDSIKHVQTAMAAAAESGRMKAETVITIWYDDLSELKAVAEVTDAEIIDFPDKGAYSENTN